MKNLKRALSFALASVMVIGMMVVGAGAADFTDADKIVNDEAVNTLVALGVIAGKEDGSYFDPTGTVTRGEMAKMITVALNGGKAPVIGTKTTPTYSDIKGHWAEAYIEYCSNLGVIAGKGDGTFAPNAVVTGTEAAKMMLVAMGWNATIFEFTGGNWALNVNSEANKVKLYDGLESIDPSAGLSRDNAAQLIYNGILAPTMGKSPNMTVTNGEITWVYSANQPSLFADKYEGLIWVGTMTGNKETGTTTEEGYIEVDGDLDNADTTVAGYTTTQAQFPSDLSIDNIGEEVKVLFKDGKSGAQNVLDDKDTIYGVFNTGATRVLMATSADIKDNKAVETKIKIGSTKYNTENNVDVWTNYVGTGTAAPVVADNATTSTNSTLTSTLKKANGDTIKFVFNSNNKIAAAYVTTSKLAKVTAVNATKVTLNNSVGTLKIADNDIYEGIAKDDVVVVTTLYHGTPTNDAAYNVVKKAEVVSGTLTGYKANENVTIDGTVYKLHNSEVLKNIALTDSKATAFTTGDIGESFDLYLVNGYVYAAAKTSESASNYSLVIDANSGSVNSVWSPLKINVLGADGVKTTLVVNDDSKKADGSAISTKSDLPVGTIVTWSGEASDAAVTVKSVTSATNYTKVNKAIGGTVTTSDAVLFAEVTSKTAAYVSDDTGTPKISYKAYALRDLKDTNGTFSIVTNSDGKIVAAYADLSGKPSGATSKVVYGIVSAFNGVIEIDDVEYYSYNIALDEETTETVNVKKSGGSLTKGNIVAYAPNSTGNYDTNSGFTVLSGNANLSTATIDGTTYDADVIAIKEYNEEDGLLTYYSTYASGSFGTLTTKALADDYKVVYVDVDGDKAGSEIGINAYDEITMYYNAIIVVDTTDNVITTVIIETSNEAEIYL